MKIRLNSSIEEIIIYHADYFLESFEKEAIEVSLPDEVNANIDPYSGNIMEGNYKPVIASTNSND